MHIIKRYTNKASFTFTFTCWCNAVETHLYTGIAVSKIPLTSRRTVEDSGDCVESPVVDLTYVDGLA